MLSELVISLRALLRVEKCAHQVAQAMWLWHGQLDGEENSKEAAEARTRAKKRAQQAKALLDPVHARFAAHGLSSADVDTLAGVLAVEELGGPRAAWRPGRRGSSCSRLVAGDGGGDDELGAESEDEVDEADAWLHTRTAVVELESSFAGAGEESLLAGPGEESYFAEAEGADKSSRSDFASAAGGRGGSRGHSVQRKSSSFSSIKVGIEPYFQRLVLRSRMPGATRTGLSMR